MKFYRNSILSASLGGFAAWVFILINTYTQGPQHLLDLQRQVISAVWQFVVVGIIFVIPGFIILCITLRLFHFWKYRYAIPVGLFVSMLWHVVDIGWFLQNISDGSSGIINIIRASFDFLTFGITCSISATAIRKNEIRTMRST